MIRPNTEPEISAYLHAKGRRLGLPVGGTFELTARCNFNCPMCYVHLSQDEINQRGKELSASQWIDLARQAKDEGVVFVLLTGGEPFVRKDFFEIYDAMKEMGLLISINTNGSMIKDDILEKLIENPPFRMNISLYGSSQDTYMKMCGLPVFEQVVENIKALKHAGVEVRLNLSVTPYNQKDLEEIYELSKELNVHVKTATYMYPPVRVDQHKTGMGNRMSPKEAAACTIRWDKLRFTEEQMNIRALNIKKYIAVDEKECAFDLDEGVLCRAGTSSFWMSWDGRMLACGMMNEPVAYPLKTGFKEAWDTIRAKTSEIRLPVKCKTCAKREICSVCAAVCLSETGSFDQVPVYVCEQVDETIAQLWQLYCERNGDHENQETAD